MANRETNVANFFQTTLTAEMHATALTATVATTVGGPASPCYMVIEPSSASQREVVYFDDTFTGTTFVTTAIGNRYLSGSAAGAGLTHPSGSVVWCTPLKQHIEDINDRVDANTLTTEQVQDIVGAMFSGNTETGVTVTYQDSDGTIDVEATATDEYIQDLVGAMFSGNTETGITATYQDSDGTIDLEVTAANAVTSLDTDVSTVTCTNTTAETTIATYTVAQGSVAAGDIIRMVVFGEFIYNAAPNSITLRVKFGATTVLATSAFQLLGGADADRGAWSLTVDLAIGSTTAQRVGSLFSYLSTPSADSWDATSAAVWGGAGYGTAAENTGSGAKALAFTVQWGAASASLTFERHAMYVTKIPAA